MLTTAICHKSWCTKSELSDFSKSKEEGGKHVTFGSYFLKLVDTPMNLHEAKLTRLFLPLTHESSVATNGLQPHVLHTNTELRLKRVELLEDESSSVTAKSTFTPLHSVLAVKIHQCRKSWEALQALRLMTSFVLFASPHKYYSSFFFFSSVSSVIFST